MVEFALWLMAEFTLWVLAIACVLLAIAALWASSAATYYFIQYQRYKRWYKSVHARLEASLREWEDLDDDLRDGLGILEIEAKRSVDE